MFVDGGSLRIDGVSFQENRAEAHQVCMHKYVNIVGIA